MHPVILPARDGGDMWVGALRSRGTNRGLDDTLGGTRQQEEPMVIDPAELESTLKRLKRVQGQIGGIVAMIEQGRDCREIVTQVAAASKALDRAGFAIIAIGLRECLLSEDSEFDSAQMEKLFLSLA